jgi:hypothetical protein
MNTAAARRIALATLVAPVEMMTGRPWRSCWRTASWHHRHENTAAAPSAAPIEK